MERSEQDSDLQWTFVGLNKFCFPLETAPMLLLDVLRLLRCLGRIISQDVLPSPAYPNQSHSTFTL